MTASNQHENTSNVVHIDEETRVINEFNQKYTTLVHGGKNYVLRLNTDAFYNSSLEFFTQKDFIDSHRDSPKIKIVINTSQGAMVKEVNPAKLWLDSPLSSSAKYGLTFHPELTKFHNNKLNTYMGRGVEPIECDINEIQLYLDHVKKVICDNENNSYEYVIKWLAHLVQKPWEKPEVAIVLHAGQGTGKGTFIDPIGRIIGSHYLNAQSPEQIVGRFNAQLENKLLVFADEFFAGSKSSTDRLKTMITERIGTIERKGQDRISVPCFARIIMATNHENVIKIERDERRYLYLSVSESMKQNAEYFTPLHALIKEKDFASKLLHYLLSIDISNFSPRNVPKTKALAEQKIDNLEPLDKWIYNILLKGSFDGASWPARVDNDVVTEQAEDWLKENGLTVWGDVPRKVGRLLTNLGSTRVRVRDGAELVYKRELPRLDEVRQKFNAHINAEIEW